MSQDEVERERAEYEAFENIARAKAAQATTWCPACQQYGGCTRAADLRAPAEEGRRDGHR